MQPSNPFQAPLAESAGRRRHRHSGFFAAIVWCCISYYAASSLTLPFANSVWLGELPVLALVQLPKSWAHDKVQNLIMAYMRSHGLSSGSPSPDMIRSSPWAFAVVFCVPAIVVLTMAAVSRNLRQSRTLIVLFLLLAVIDAAVTIWFERTSSLSLF